MQCYGNWCMFESHALSESGIGYPVPFFPPPTFSKSNLSDSPYIFHFFKVLLWSVEVLGRMGESFCTVALWWLGWDFRANFLLGMDSQITNLDWMGGTLPHVYWWQVFLSFKQFALCLCSIPSLGAEHSAHWGSWSLVSRGLIKKMLHNMGDGAKKVF